MALNATRSPLLCPHGVTEKKGCRFGCQVFECVCWSCEGTGFRIRLGTTGDVCGCVEADGQPSESARVTALLDAARDVPCDLVIWERDVRSAPAALRAWAAVQEPRVKLSEDKIASDEDNHVAESVLWCDLPGHRRISVYLLPKT
jgi:hypothetical protein